MKKRKTPSKSLNTYLMILIGIFLLASTLLDSAQAEVLQLDTPALSDDELDQLCGGFLGDDFMIGFGINEVIKIDGQLVSQTVLNIPKVRLPELFSTTNFVIKDAALGNNDTISVNANNGALNTAITLNGLANAFAPFVIQNSFDNKTIQHGKIVNIELSGLNFSNSGMHSMIKSRLIDSIR